MPITVKQITPEEAAVAPTLDIEAQEGPLLAKGTAFHVNACGYVDSERRVNDGCVYIGTQGKTAEEECANDIVLPAEEQGLGKKHMVIKYNPETHSYALKDLGDGTGTFVKVDSALTLKQGYIISFGDSHMAVNIRLNEKIQLKFLDGPKTDQTFTFHSGDGTIKVGRMSDCEIRFDDNSLSRYQCSICYDTNQWVLEDGYRGKSSTNGTWLFADEFCPVKDGLVFKAGQTLYSIHVKPGQGTK